jgi:hypothetical protein
VDRKRLIALAGLVLAAGAFWVVVFALLAPTTPSHLGPRIEDVNSIRNVLGMLAHVRKSFPFAADGRLAAYEAFEPGEREQLLPYFRSVRTGKGPTLAEVRANDYRNYPWGRHKRVPGREPVPGRGKVPMLWDLVPDEEGGRLVGFSDGAVKWLEEPDVQVLLERHGQR